MVYFDRKETYFSPERLIAQFEKGEVRALSRVISLVENNQKLAQKILSLLYPRIGKAYRIGITGPPGAGKSSLVEKLSFFFIKEGLSLGIVCIDPTSPFSGGAILGDRVRMSSLFLEPQVFIRSMASRGALGGLALRTKEVCDVLDAFGKDIIIIETVGVGQVEIDITKTAYTVIVTLVPESGDTIQTLKAGLLEIGDIFLINKADREGADRLAMELETTLRMKENNNHSPPIIKTCALSGEGLEELFSAINRHRNFMEKNHLIEKKRKEIIASEIKELIEEKVRQKIWESDEIQRIVSKMVDEIWQKRRTPFEASDNILEILKCPPTQKEVR